MFLPLPGGLYSLFSDAFKTALTPADDLFVVCYSLNDVLSIVAYHSGR